MGLSYGIDRGVNHEMPSSSMGAGRAPVER